MSKIKKVLFINSAANHENSITRELSSSLEAKYNGIGPVEIRHRDLENTELPLMDKPLFDAYFSAPEHLNAEQKRLLSISEKLIEELKWADEIVIGAPIYNFSVPARLKAWIDLVCRAGLTFEYTDNGPRGLLNIEKAYLVVASGGTPIGSDIDFASGYLKQIARFIGIDNAEVIRADGSKWQRAEIIERANSQINGLLAT